MKRILQLLTIALLVLPQLNYAATTKKGVESMRGKAIRQAAKAKLNELVNQSQAQSTSEEKLKLLQTQMPLKVGNKEANALLKDAKENLVVVMKTADQAAVNKVAHDLSLLVEKDTAFENLKNEYLVALGLLAQHKNIKVPEASLK